MRIVLLRDWLQVLSCNDKSREYFTNGDLINLDNAITYFCSSDRIAIVYALYLGINCIRQKGKNDYTYNFFKSKYPTMANSEQITQSFQELQSILYVKSVDYLQTSIMYYTKFSKQLLHKIKDIDTAISVDNIKRTMKYALHYSYLLINYNQIHKYPEVINQFILNPFHSDFEIIKNKQIIL
jgi:hypothetical protein